MEILLGTTNKGKVIEIGEVINDLPITLITPSDLPIFATLPPPKETAATLKENALLKATFYHEYAHLPTLAEDSGIFIPALADELGIHTRRWGAGAEATDEEWIDFFLKRMERESDRRARFACSVAYIDPSASFHTFEGVCDGVIASSVEATYLPGLPISGCFRPNEATKVFSALSVEEKNRLSHRGRGFAAWKSFFLESQ